MLKSLAAAFGTLLLLSAGSAGAIALDLSGEAAVQIATTGTYDDPEVGTITFSAGPTGASLRAGSPIGVDCTEGSYGCYWDDPATLGWMESLSIDFGDSGAFLKSVTLSDLNVLGSPDSVLFVDAGFIDLGSRRIAFSALDAVAGSLTVEINAEVEAVRLTTANLRGASFRLAGVSYDAAAPVPEVDAATLFGVGGLVVALLTWRKATASA